MIAKDSPKLNKIVCTICSKKKDKETGLMPAEFRYLSSRITQVGDIAKSEGCPFYILSGEYGLISSNKQIPYYDHLLIKDEVKELSTLVDNQLRECGYDEIDFYIETDDPNWEPYLDVLRQSVKRLGIKLNEIILKDK